ncbi:hypothetical protein SAMN05444281_2287 [Wenyingzhuangia marina]|uniref:CarboxypepD_reg-like domain-containing protein n=2 Tax=Wenyingzhuangia marina TaxID=1195760 RepID=A0A1M5W8F1_9FLAO|nr:hypothetical protein GCM10011397_17810 [Wenyingzhuangia marina]SHH83473.1 hypothetical protein SAMN05444281_2287 [Wenyingzhuangia marina]
MFILVVSTVSSSFSQEVKFLKGLVVNDSIDVADVTVTNKNLKQSTKTNNSGVFELPVRIGDSIMVSAIHINKISLLITQEIIDNESLKIEVEENINNMEEVVLNNVLSESSLSFNVGPTTNPDPEKLERIKLKHLTNTDPTRTFQGGNILGLFSLVSKLFKNKNGKKYLSKQEKRVRFERFKVDFVKEFGSSFFTDDLNISEFRIDEFLTFCNQKKSIYKMYSKDEKLELIDFLIKQSKEYKKEMNIEN